MITDRPQQSSDRLVEEALALLANAHALPGDDRDGVLSAWLARSPAHAHAMADAQAEWDLLGALPDDSLTGIQKAQLVSETLIASAWDHPVRSASVLSLIIAFAATPILVTQLYSPQLDSSLVAHLRQYHHDSPNYQENALRYVTTRGEQREVDLPNGGKLWLNWNTEVLVAQFDNEIHVDVVKGDAFLSVSGDQEHPLVIHAGKAFAYAPQTEIAIHSHSPEDAFFQVKKGVVTIASSEQSTARELGAAQQSYYYNGAGGEIQTASLNSIAAWREGKLIFDERPLAEVLGELTHYTKQVVTIGTIQNADNPVSATYSIDDADNALLTLANAYDLELVSPASNAVLVQSAGGNRD